MSPVTKLESMVATASFFVLACRFIEDNPDHCSNNDGDAHCAELHPGAAVFYCEAGTKGCITPGHERFGCVAERPKDECYSPCGGRSTLAENGGCLPDSETTEATTSTSTTSTTSTPNSTDGTTGPTRCTVDDDCMEPMPPFCETTSGECVACDAFGASSDAKCAALDPMAPFCVDGMCVECTEHGQCSSEACELASRRCFPEDVVLHVDGDEIAMPPQLFASVVTAVSAVPDDTHAIIVVHEQGAMGQTPYTAAVLVDGDKTIALLAAPGEAPIIRGAADHPGVRVRGAGTGLYVDGIQISDNLGNIGVEVSNGALAWLDRSRIVRNTGGGILARDRAMLTLRNCFVDGDQSSDVLRFQESTAVILYSTLGADLGTSRALACDGASSVTVRNSLLVSLDFGPEVDCPPGSLVASYSAAEVQLEGMGNVSLGNMDGTDAAIWFEDYDAGDFHLVSPPLSVATAAQWMDGDPTVDIDGQPRPQVNRALDIVGADIPMD